MRLVIFAFLGLVAINLGCRSNPKEQTDSVIDGPKKEKTSPQAKQKQVRASVFTNNPPARPMNVPVEGSITGRILQVDQRLRFVVVDFGTGRLPQLEQKLSVYRLDQKVAEIKISGPYRNTTAAADITAGEVKYGDFVKQD